MVFTNRELSEKLNINFAKLRRWAREFTPAHIDRGYHREYSFKEAFKIYLAGNILDLGFNIAETKEILGDLEQWLNDNGFYSSRGGMTTPIKKDKPKVLRWNISIRAMTVESTKVSGFNYTVKGYLVHAEQIKHQGGYALKDIYVMDFIDPLKREPGETKSFYEHQTKILKVSMLRQMFFTSTGAAG